MYTRMFFAEALNKLLKTGEKRNIRIKKNIVASFVLRSLSVSINLLIVSQAIKYVDAVQYGVWLTLTSIISWFTYFDFGMGNGFRNKLTTAIAFKEHEKAKKYVSTTYAVFAIIAVSIFLAFYFINPYIDWSSALNIPSTVDGNIHFVLLVLLGTLCIQFVLQLMNVVLNALHEPARVELITLIGQVGMLVTLIVLKYTVKGSLSVLIVALNVAPLVTILLATLIFYGGRHRAIAPSLRSIDFSYVKSILNLGSSFFIIQMGSLILHQTDNIIITRILGPEAVTQFNVTYKLYYVVFVGFAIITSPFWSAFTDAYAKKDFEWIKKSVKRLRDIWLFTSLVVVPLFFLGARIVFKVLFPEVSGITSSLSATMGVYIICSTCLSFTCCLLYGIGKLRVLLILYLVVILVNIPLGIVLGKLLGVEGVILANIVSYVFMNTVLWIQTSKILRNTASGIWNR